MRAVALPGVVGCGLKRVMVLVLRGFGRMSPGLSCRAAVVWVVWSLESSQRMTVPVLVISELATRRLITSRLLLGMSNDLVMFLLPRTSSRTLVKMNRSLRTGLLRKMACASPNMRVSFLYMALLAAIF